MQADTLDCERGSSAVAVAKVEAFALVFEPPRRQERQGEEGGGGRNGVARRRTDTETRGTSRSDPHSLDAWVAFRSPANAGLEFADQLIKFLDSYGR